MCNIIAFLLQHCLCKHALLLPDTYIVCLVWLLSLYERMLSAGRNLCNDQVMEILQEAVWLKALCSLCYKGRQNTVTDCVVCCWPWQWFSFRRAICPLWQPATDAVQVNCILLTEGHYILWRLLMPAVWCPVIWWRHTNILEELLFSIISVAAGFSVMSVHSYQTTGHHSPEYIRLFCHCPENFK
jgi:hypothetical protein